MIVIMMVKFFVFDDILCDDTREYQNELMKMFDFQMEEILFYVVMAG